MKLFKALMEWMTGVKPRSPKWPATRKTHLIKNPTCAACGTKTNLEVHHCMPFHCPEGEELELVESNLITLCESSGHNCHLIFGHLLSWKSYNPDVRSDAAIYLNKVENRSIC